jgi:4-hydroxybenzoate polyprenyltransferase
MARVVGALTKATHPIPAAFVTILVGALTGALGASGWRVIIAMIATGLGQASVGWSNDYIDRLADRAAGRVGKPLVDGALSPKIVIRGAWACAIASPFVCWPLGWRPALVMAVGVASAWAYNAFLKRTLLSWLPYSVSFALLPVFAWLVARSEAPPGWVIGCAAGLGAAAHLMNTIPDLESDRRVGMRGIAHQLGARRSLAVSSSILAAELLLVVVQTRALEAPRGSSLAVSSLGAVAVVATAHAGITGKLRRGWYLTLVSVATLVGALLLGLDRAGL